MRISWVRERKEKRDEGQREGREQKLTVIKYLGTKLSFKD